MAVIKVETPKVRAGLEAMAHTTAVLARVADLKTPGSTVFGLPWADTVASWCLAHYAEHREAPGRDVLVYYYDMWRATTRQDAQVVAAVATCLNDLLPPEGSVEWQLDVVADGIRYAELQLLNARLTALLEKDEVKKADELLAMPVRRVGGTSSFCMPAAEPGAFAAAYSSEMQEEMVVYPGAAGEFFSRTLQRSQFYSFMAPDKTGKTCWMVDLAYRAMRQRRQVAFFDTGDSPEADVLARLGCRAARLPPRDCSLRLPMSIDANGALLVAPREYAAVTAYDAYREFSRAAARTSAFRLDCRPSDTVTVADISQTLTEWSRADNWRPDVVVIDYADLLVAPGLDANEAIDAVWKGLRRLSVEHSCLVVTATQSNAAAYRTGKTLLNRSHFSGRKTKLAHVNGMIGINVDDDERAAGMARLNWVVLRKWAGQRPMVHTAGVYAFDFPIFLSY